MAYIGNTPAEAYTSIDKQTITGDGGASYTLDHAVANENEIEVFVNNVRQEPSVAYTVSGTALTMTGNVESSDDFYVVFQGKAIQTTSHPEGQDLKARDGTFSGDLTVDTDTLYVDSTNDRVGVNTSSPARNLEVTGGTQGLLRISGSTNGGAVECWDGTNGIYFGSNPAVTGTGNSGDLAVYVDTGYVQTYWTGGAERMRIDSSGNVGIGTTSPSNTLHVVDTSNTGHIRLGDNGNSDYIRLLSQSVSGYASLKSEGDLYLDRTGSNTIFRKGSTENMRINSAGNLLIGTTTQNGAGGMTLRASGTDPEVMLNKTYSGNINGVRCQHNSTYVGGITYNNTSTAFNTSSDHRLKENAVDMTGAIARVKNLQPKRFNFIADDTNTLVDGFMAHEAQTVVPEAVQGTHNEVDADGNPVYQGIDQAKLVPLLTGALQEAIAKIEALETRVQALEDA